MNSSDKTLVKLDGLSKNYTRGKITVEVLADLDLSVDRGDFLSLMGPSGSGKSTLLNLVGGLDQPTSGSIEIAGQRIDNMSSSQLASWRATHIGFVFQFYNLLPVLTAHRNIELPLLLTHLSRKQRKAHVETALEIVGLADRAHHRPAELSGGEQQRVAIARAVVSDATLLVCDEPTGDLDRSTADEILELLELLNSEHDKTIIMVTHDPKASEHASHTLHLDKGTLVTGEELA
jgi:putative ABC transport system ATP-binding protein|tara:strand:- start:5201 stop:5902 length:702 start_codon:yes stop_codon:yes gene_type:complete